ncbi:MAG: ABC transporter ATP-binding protein [Verrucomicrobiales bacterium]|nr:ABC transporter ATP-binding protein [Verrucomicrobiales bacterium]
MSGKSEKVIELTDITKSFGSGRAKVDVLRGIDLTVDAGEMLMIEGPSGCGKTTLLSIISGTLKPDAGKVVVLGKEITKARNRNLAKFRARHLGFAFQLFNLIPSISIWENVSVPLLIQGIKGREAKKRSIEILKEVGLDDRSSLLPNKLSGGQQQRVAIARALVHEPEIIICDEPTSALDGATGEHIMTILRQLTAEKNATVVIVTHDPRIHHFADRIVHMEDGKLLKS